MREWITIYLICGLLLATLAISFFSKVHADYQLKIFEKQARAPIFITLSGEVGTPGVYEVEPGTTVKEILKKTTLLEGANRKKIPFKKVLFSTQTVEIPAKKRKSSREKKISLVGN